MKKPLPPSWLTYRHQLSSTFNSFLVFGLLLLSFALQAQITGTAFRDYNGNGTQEGGEPGRDGIIVNFYSNPAPPAKDALVGSTMTNASGDYTFNPNPGDYPIRVEFEIPDGLCNISSMQDYSGGNGDNYGTAVQFANGPGTHDFVVAYPYDFSSEASPLTFLSVMGNGDPLPAGSAGDNEGIIQFNYQTQGTASNSGRGGGGPMWNLVATQRQVGTTWGMAVSRQARTVFMASHLRRHAGLGPEGSGGIYWFNADGPFPTAGSLKFINFDTDLGIPTSGTGAYSPNFVGGTCSGSGEVIFSDIIGSNADRGLPTDETQPSADPAAWAQVGRLSFGDIDISENGQYLYVVNLHDRMLYQIDLQDPFNPQVPTAAQVQGFQIPDPCNGGDPTNPRGEYRPFALKVARGKVFVGVTCSGQNADGTNPPLASSSNMLGTVYEWDPTSQTFDLTPKLQFDFSYRDGTGQPWVPWRRDWWFLGGDRDGSPLLSDIEFDAQGNMILGIMDMHASQLGHRNANLCGSCCPEDARQVGDILQAVRDKTAQDCEYSIQFTPEYYSDNHIHAESAMGALSVHFTADFDGVLGTMMDPIGIWSSGVMLWDNQTGNKQNTGGGPGYETTYSSSSNQGKFGKANSLGDVETLGQVPPLEIGNYIWIDTDRDGIQDAGEPPVAGVTVELIDDMGNVVAMDVTDANGNYIFNYLNVDDRGPGKVDVLGPQPNSTYTVRISPTQFSAGKGSGVLEGTFLTLTDEVGSNGVPDYQDNDADLDGNGYAVITVMTGEVGANNHTYDFGLQETFHDLALKKVTAQTQPVKPGDDVVFSIWIYNQGAGLADANDIEITDYVPSGYDFIPGDNPGWSGSPPLITYDYAGPLVVGDSAEILLTLKVNPTAQPDNVINEAEISYFEDEDDNVPVDEDSTPDNDPDNDNDVIPYSDDDNEINERAKLNPGDDEDDNDVETVPLFDLALSKVVAGGQPSSFSYGNNIIFEITVTNQGNLSATDIEIVDYVPSGFTYNPISPINILQGWTPAPTNMPIKTIAGPLAPGASTTVQIELVVLNADPDAGAYVNYAEIKSTKDGDGNDTTNRDVDSQPDMSINNDAGGNPETPEDNHIDDNGQDSDGDGITDEDDHDPALVHIYDLALRKTVVTPPYYLEGDLIEFEIEVHNQGNFPADNISIIDYVPNGFAYDQGDNPGWSAGPNPTYNITGALAPGDMTTVSIFLEAVNTDGPESDWWNYAEINAFTDENGNLVEDADSNPGSNNGTESSVEPESDADDNIASTDKGGEEDDHDVAGIELSEFDLALRKTTSQTNPVKIDDDVTFTITVYNQGDAPADNIDLVDYIPCGFEFQNGLNPGWTEVGGVASYTMTGLLQPGDSAKVDIVLTVLGGLQMDSTCVINEAEIAGFTDEDGIPRPDIDSTPDDDPDNDNDVTPGSPDDNEIDEDGLNNPGDDEDDNDVAMVNIYDLALRKTTVTPEPYRYGDVVVFNIEVHNQGTMPADEIRIVDYVPNGFTYDPNETVNQTYGWTGAATTTPQMTISTELGVGEMTTVQIALTVTPGSTAIDRFINNAEIVESEDDDGNDMSDYDYDSSPDNNRNNDAGGQVYSPEDDHILDDGMDTNGDGIIDEDDHDPEGIEIFDLALNKVRVTDMYSYGEEIVFDITVENQGTVVAENIVVTDNVPEGYTYDQTNNPDWTQAVTTSPQTTIPGPLNPGESVTVQISLTLEQVGTPDNRSWVNYAWIETAVDTNGLVPVDADSDMGTDAPHERDVLPGDDNDNEVDEHYIPDGGNADEDDHDPAQVEVFDLALIKEVAANGPFTYGQSVPFEITIYNQGNVPAHDVIIYDYVKPGFEFDVAMNFPLGWTYVGDPINIAQRTIADVNPLNPGESITITIWLTVVPTDGSDPDAWTNRAEISSARDENGQPTPDIDSNPDGSEDNDNGGEPNTPTDDQLDGDGTDDEDDADPALIEIVDLALRKRVVTPGPYAYGDVIDFEITVFNQGNVTSRNTEVTDYIPVGYSFSDILNPTWSNTAPTVTTIIPGDLDPSDSAKVTIRLTIEMTTGGQKDWINYAEITNVTDTLGTNRNLDEADSTPGSNGTDENEVEPWDDEDDDIDSNDKGGEEDDHDPAGIEIQDLAVFMLDDTDILANYGDDVTFPIMVFNQGSVTNDGFTLTNYIPSGYLFNGGDNPGWVQINDSTVTYTYPNNIVPGEQVDLVLVLEAQPSKGENAWTNVIEISVDNPVSLLGDNGLVDIDSDPDQTRTNDAGGAVETASDDVVNGDGRNGGGTPGDQDPASDEDDQDPEVVRVFDLALRKELVTVGPYVYGTVHEFSVCIINQGNEPMTSVQVQDYIPEGYSFNAGMSTGWSPVNASTVQYTIDRIEDCDTICVPLFLNFEMTDGGDLDWINYAEITEMMDTTGIVRDDVDSNPGSDGPGERDVKPWDPADDDTDSTDEGGEEDDHDPAGPEVFDLAVFMLDDTDILANYGDDVTFPIMVFNQGNIPSDGFTLTNYIPSGYTFNAGDNPGWVQVNDSTVTYDYGSVINPEEQVDLQLILEAQPSKGEDAWTNVIEISDDNPVSPSGQDLVDIDSDPDQIRTNDAGGAVETGSDDVVNGDGKNGGGTPLDENGATDEDDQDPEIVRVFDLALRKELVTAEPYFYGQDHEFEICVINQGNEPMLNVEVTDHIPIGYTFNGGLSAGWGVQDDSTVTYVIDRIEDCDTVCISVWMTLEMTDGGRRNWINYSEITAMTDTLGEPQDDVDSNLDSDGPGEREVEPGDPADDDTDSNDEGGEEDDHDPAGPTIYDLALIKTSQDLGPFEYGDVITFDIWVYNQGNIPATQVEVSEYIPIGYEWQVANNGNWSWDAGNRIATLTSKMAAIAPGDSAMVQLDLEILQSYEVGAWDNYAEISNTDDPNEDIDSDPDSDEDNDQGGDPNTPDDDEKDEDGKNNPDDDEDDHDPHRPKIVDLALNKRVPNKEPFYIPGDTVPFKITVYNQGNEPAANTLIKDYMPQGFFFDITIPENLGWSDNAGTLEYTYGPVLNSQDSVMIDLYLVVQIAANPTLDDWRNYAEIGIIRDTLGNDISDLDADSYPSSDADHERDVRDNDDGDLRDDQVTGDYKSDPNEDEDDHDPEEVEVTGALGDFVWKDLDGDGIQDPGEPGVEGVIVTLYECDGTFVRMDTTDNTGFYFFDFLLPLRSYYAVFDISPLNNPDCVFTFPNQGVQDSLDSDVNAAGVGPCTYIEPGERDSTYDAGLVELASLGDYVWHDRNADGIQDGGDEEGIPNVIVRLYDNEGTLIGQTETDANGYYLFDDLMPMEYYVEFEYMDMWRRSPANVGGDDEVDSDVDDSNGPNTTRLIDLDPGDNDLTWDLGLYKCIPFGDFVWYDVDADGVQDAPENGINGVRVYLYDGNDNLVDEAVTGPDPHSASGDGYYKFCVDPGTYYVVFERPGHLASSRSFQGGDNEKDSDINHHITMYSTFYYTVRSGDMRCDIDGGYHSKATMGDNVWYDENQNGLQDAGEQGVSGVVISAYDNNDRMFWQDVSNQDGEFYMDGLSTGEYYLKFDPPAGYTFTLPDAGQNDGLDSDVDGSNGPRTTALYSVSPGEHEPDVDGGLVTGFLPTELLDFRVRLRGDDVDVIWRTDVEINNDYFEVERRHESEDDFRVIGMIEAAGTSYTAQDYKLVDEDLARNGVYYYRLRQVDYDGRWTRSHIETIELQGNGSGLSLYPNPASDVVNVEFTTLQKGEMKIEIQDKLGRDLPEFSKTIEVESGRQSQTLEIENLASGVYNVRLEIDGQVHHVRLTKVR